MKKKHVLFGAAAAALLGTGTYFVLDRHAEAKPDSVPVPHGQPDLTSLPATITPVSDVPTHAANPAPVAKELSPAEVLAISQAMAIKATNMISDADKSIIDSTFASFDKNASCKITIESLPWLGSNGVYSTLSKDGDFYAYEKVDGEPGMIQKVIWDNMDVTCQSSPAEVLIEQIYAAYSQLNLFSSIAKSEGFPYPGFQLVISVGDQDSAAALSFTCQDFKTGALQCTDPVQATPLLLLSAEPVRNNMTDNISAPDQDVLSTEPVPDGVTDDILASGQNAPSAPNP